MNKKKEKIHKTNYELIKKKLCKKKDNLYKKIN